MDLNCNADLHFADGIILSLNCDFFWREGPDYEIYNNAVALVQSGKNSTVRYIVNQPQAQVRWDIERRITFIAIYVHFFADADQAGMVSCRSSE